MKVHLDKIYPCTKCNKMSFTNEANLKKHFDYCGTEFKCLDCSVVYSCYETLKTHSRRKSHTILNKCEYRPIKTIRKNYKETPVRHYKKKKFFKNRFILPKFTIELDKNTTPLVINIDQGVQTERKMPELRNITTQVLIHVPAAMSNSETQTFPNTISKNITPSTAETQTIEFEMNEFLKVRKNETTQTNKIPLRNQSSNTFFDFDELDFVTLNSAETNSSSTQTIDIDTSANIYSTSTNTHDSIHTDTSDLLTDNMNDSLDTLFNCHTETQTDLFENELFGTCDFSSMYTQTGDNVLYGLGFNDCETQTVLDSFLKSVESQTIVSHTKKMIDGGDFMHNIETQTDVLLPQILEEIHS